MGAKVLHPKCLRPAEVAKIPVAIRMTSDPHTPGTTITDDVDTTPAVMAVVHRTNVTLLTLSTLQMWQESGFLSKAFAPFRDLGMSIDLVATSQSTVSITLDHIPGGVEGAPFKELEKMLRDMAGPYGSLEINHGGPLTCCLGCILAGQLTDGVCSGRNVDCVGGGPKAPAAAASHRKLFRGAAS